MARLPTKVCKASMPPDRSTYHNNVMPSHLGLLFSCYENCCADIANLIHHVLSLAAAWRQPTMSAPYEVPVTRRPTSHSPVYRQVVDVYMIRASG
jgi:hypothetical protein